ncbi:MAG: cyclic nucleotide-binding domain-containing protein [Pseudomonadota bacterium]
MLEEILRDPELARHYHSTWEAGQVLFEEGEESQDLYLLLSGSIDVLKSQQKINQISEPGSLFGEMSFLLGSRRTATLRARTDVETVRVAREQVPEFLSRFPSAAQAIARLLAERLVQTTHVLQGMKEFCDQLPDAVVFSGPQGQVQAFNLAAARLFGRDANQVLGQSTEKLYQQAGAYRELAEEVMKRGGEMERVLVVEHPTKGPRQLATSISPLRDSHHELVGLVSISRDITASERFRRRARLATLWALPLALLLVFTAAAAYWDIPPFDRGVVHYDTRQQQLRDLVGRDFLLLQKMILPELAGDNPGRLTARLHGFLAQPDGQDLYRAVLVLDPSRKVLAAATRDPNQFPAPEPGSAYASLNPDDAQSGSYRLLTLYRMAPGQPNGYKSLEMAFALGQGERLAGWLVLALNDHLLDKKYNTDEATLQNMRFITY